MKQSFTVLMLLPVLLAACTSATQPALTRTPSQPTGSLGALPAALAGLPRAEVNRGETVIRESHRFYNTNATFLEAVVAHYRNENGLATLWVARAETASDASAVVESFIGEVRAGRMLYTLNETRTVNGTTLYVLQGQRRVQYLFSAGDRVMLLDVFPKWAERASQDLLAALP